MGNAKLIKYGNLCVRTLLILADLVIYTTVLCDNVVMKNCLVKTLIEKYPK